MAKPRNDSPSPARGPALDAITAACEAAKNDVQRQFAVNLGDESIAWMLGEMVEEARARARKALYRVIIAGGAE